MAILALPLLLVGAHSKGIEMTDSDFLNWIADRIVNIYGESEQVDFVLRLRRMAKHSEIVNQSIDNLLLNLRASR